MQTSNASSGAATKIKPRTDPWINFILPIARHQSVAQRQTVCELTVMRKCSVMFRTSVITSNLSEKTEKSQATQRIALRTYRARRLPPQAICQNRPRNHKELADCLCHESRLQHATCEHTFQKPPKAIEKRTLRRLAVSCRAVL